MREWRLKLNLPSLRVYMNQNSKSYSKLKKWHKEALQMKRENPLLTLTEIGTKFNVTRQAVSLLFRPFDIRGRPKSHSLERPCLNCGKPLKRQKMYCSNRCFSSHSRVTLTCELCGSNFSLYRSYIQSRRLRGQKHFFCSHRCLGSWIGTQYGRGSEYQRLKRIDR